MEETTPKAGQVTPQEAAPAAAPAETPEAAPAPSSEALAQAAAALEQAAAAGGSDPNPETAAALEQAAAALKQAAEEQKQHEPQNLKERLYDKVRIPIWLLDVIIWGCVAGILFCIIFGRS